MIKHAKSDDFNTLISNKKVLVDFYATWCAPCKMLGMVLEKIDAKEIIDIIKVDIDSCEDLTNKYNIYSVPTLILFEDGKEIKRISGFMPEDDLIKWVK